MQPSEVLGPEGPFATLLPGFRARAAQQAMADAVAEAIPTHGDLLIEAGTGTGKTFAYLVPALLAGTRTLISTATRTLQDQLFTQDLPLVTRALGHPGSIALLKGRANYLCLHRLAQAEGQPELLPADQARLVRVTDWARGTVAGDIAELHELPEDAPIWPLVTSTSDNCLGQGCPQFEACFVVQARRRAVAADIVVVNHHLLFADMALREEGFGELLPTAGLVIVDEAHQLPELATQAFGQAVSGRQLRELARDTHAAMLREAPDTPGLRDGARRLEAAVQQVQLRFARVPGRHEFGAHAGDADAHAPLDTLAATLGWLAAGLDDTAARGPELEACARRAADLASRLGQFMDRDGTDWVRWLEANPRGFALHATPLDVSAQFQGRRTRYGATWVYCSATLALDGDFGHFQRELGLEQAATAHWDSPFDYARQALCYLPPMPCNPGDDAYLAAVCAVACEVIMLSRGRAFLLCTSHRALGFYAGPLRTRLPYPVLVQGEAPRAALLAEFKRLGNAVLIGTATFWEGVDVRGDALSCVVIDKLPFAPPDDPVFRARARRLEAAGSDPFREYQLPVAALMLKQGAGRLIRAVEDRGVLVLCDPRLRTRGYGRTFLRALPPLPQTRELRDVAAFFAAS
ncbi:MAG: ATP-dependent DNA helicase [Gammaproteobacteria bacterium]